MCIACNKNEAEVPAGTTVETSYTVTMDGWQFSKGDKLSLLSGQYKADLTAETAGESVVFSGEAPKLPDNQKYLAIYASGQENCEPEGNGLTFSLSPVVLPQTGKPCGAVATGRPENGTLKLNHLTAFVSFTISRADISSLIIRSNGKNVAGTIKVALDKNAAPSGKSQISNGNDALIINDILTPGTYTLPLPAQGYDLFSFTLTTAEGSAEKSVKKSVNLSYGKTTDLGVIDNDLSFAQNTATPIVELLDATSSTVAVTWSISGFNDVFADMAQKWSAGLYKDQACKDLLVSWNFPASTWGVSDGNNIYALEGPYSPRFIFSGLSSSTAYFVKVWFTDNPAISSAPVEVTTLSSTVKTLPEGFAAEGDVILEEDFSELVWGGDVATRSYGYSDGNRSEATALHSAFGENPIGKQTIDGFEHNWYLVWPGREMGLFNTLRKAMPSTRLNEWTSLAEDNTDGKVLARPGYIKLGASSQTGALVTPALNCLEHRAVVRLSFKAHPYRESVNDPLTASVKVVSTEEKGVSVLKAYTISKQEDFMLGEAQQWTDYSFELMVQPGDRLAISSRREGTDANQRRMLVDDVKVELLEYRPQEKVYAIRTTQDWQDFVTGYASYEAGETVTLENDLDLEGIHFNAIPSFAGTLDGKGHALKNWTSEGMPLFTSLGKNEGEGGTVKNLVLDASCSLTPSLNGNFGFIAATVQSSGVIDGVQVQANAVPVNVQTLAAPHTGMIAGVSYGLIQNCINNGNLSITSAAGTGNAYIGGIVGYINAGDKVGLLNNENNGDITYSMNGAGMFLYMGGISAGTSTAKIADAKNSKGTIENCVNTGKISYTTTNGGSMAENEGTGRTGNYFKVGGVVGYFEGNVIDCTNRGEVSARVPTNESAACTSGPSIGGVAAFVLRNMTGCNNYGSVSVSGTFAGGNTDNQGCGITGEFAAGGVVGQIGAKETPEAYTLSDCHNYGELNFKGWMAYNNGTGFNFGGVVGYAGAPVTNCSNEAAMQAESKGAFVRMGGVAGRIVGQKATSLENKGTLDFRLVRSTAGAVDTYKQLASELRAGGVAAYIGGDIEDCSNSGKLQLSVVAEDHLSANLQAGGIVGYTDKLTSLSGNNFGEMDITYNGKSLRVGGLIGETVKSIAFSQLVNNGNVSVKATSTGQSWIGGVLGSMPNGTATLSGLENNGTLQVQIDNATSNAFYYISGVSASSGTGYKYSDCKNMANITYTGKAKVRIGGVCAYTNQNTVNCSASGNIKATCTGYDYSEVGGVCAYTAATGLSGWQFAGSIDTSESTTKVYTGGLLGKSNGNAAFNSCRFEGELRGASHLPGLYVGGLQADGLKMTFGATGQCVVAAGSSVNGTEITELAKENLVSQSSDNGTFTSNATLNNIVIQ